MGMELHYLFPLLFFKIAHLYLHSSTLYLAEKWGLIFFKNFILFTLSSPLFPRMRASITDYPCETKGIEYEA